MKDPNKRLSLEMILKHPWLSGGKKMIPDYFEIDTLKMVPTQKFLTRFKILTAEANAMLNPLEIFIRNALEK